MSCAKIYNTDLSFSHRLYRFEHTQLCLYQKLPKKSKNSFFFPKFLPKTLQNPFFPEKRTVNLRKQLQTQKTIVLSFLVFKTMKQYLNKLKIPSKCSQNDRKAKTRKNLQEFSSFLPSNSKKPWKSPYFKALKTHFTWKTKVKAFTGSLRVHNLSNSNCCMLYNPYDESCRLRLHLEHPLSIQRYTCLWLFYPALVDSDPRMHVQAASKERAD